MWQMMLSYTIHVEQRQMLAHYAQRRMAADIVSLNAPCLRRNAMHTQAWCNGFETNTLQQHCLGCLLLTFPVWTHDAVWFPDAFVLRLVWCPETKPLMCSLMGVRITLMTLPEQLLLVLSFAVLLMTLWNMQPLCLVVTTALTVQKFGLYSLRFRLFFVRLSLRTVRRRFGLRSVWHGAVRPVYAQISRTTMIYGDVSGKCFWLGHRNAYSLRRSRLTRHQRFLVTLHWFSVPAWITWLMQTRKTAFGQVHVVLSDSSIQMKKPRRRKQECFRTCMPCGSNECQMFQQCKDRSLAVRANAWIFHPVYAVKRCHVPVLFGWRCAQGVSFRTHVCQTGVRLFWRAALGSGPTACKLLGSLCWFLPFDVISSPGLHQWGKCHVSS